MTGRQKIECAFSPDGTPDIGVVIPYEGIFIRDHWDHLTSCPWWYIHSPSIEYQLLWRREVIANTGYDWIGLPSFHSREERRCLFIDDRADGIYLVNHRTGKEVLLQKPAIGGWSHTSKIESVHPIRLPHTFSEIEEAITEPSVLDAEEYRRSGLADLADRILSEFGDDLFPIYSVGSPLWMCYSLWGFEGMMRMVAEQPELVEFACERFLLRACRQVRVAAVLGCAGVWIEECMTDMISPVAFDRLSAPYVRRLCEEIHSAGMKSIYYFCGNPADRWEAILSVPFDAISLEESKKGFVIEIEDVVEKIGGRRVVFGNLDAIRTLQDGTDDELRDEIERQICAGRANGSRFVVSLGSPVTPLTSVQRVRLYCDIAREVGARR